jgi:hypothetical protein
MTRARRRTLEEREAVSRGLKRWHERRRIAAERRLERLRVAPTDLLAIEAGDVESVRPELLPLVSAGADEAHALLEAQGGADRASPQRTTSQRRTSGAWALSCAACCCAGRRLVTPS